jgi:murein DD-endopeptidase MepM/ murein hydrolase activator NlpD
MWVLRRATSGLVAWRLLLPITAFAVDESYIVKHGDTIFAIARSYGIPPAVLAERNGLSRNYHLYLGQRLTIPIGRSHGTPPSQAKHAPEATARTQLPRSIQRAIDRADVRPGRWQYIVIHHSGVDTGTMKSMDHYHREVRHMENGLAYDFVIGNGNGMSDGEIAVGPRWTRQLDRGHLASEAQNKIALGICLVGNFDEHQPSGRQLQSLRGLVEALMARCRLTSTAVKTHQQINIVHTRCPGTRFPAASFIGSLKVSPG